MEDAHRKYSHKNRMLKRLFSKNFPSRSADVPPDPGAILRLTAEELLSPHGSVLKKIEELAGVPRDYYRRYYETALHSYASFVQQLPASESHHHATLGGMLQHGLEVAMIALKLRRAYLLPPGAKPEAITQKQDLWTYAIFSAALCHDIGKPVIDQAVTVYDTDGNVGQWVPWTGPMADSVKWYRAKFRRDRVHRLHGKSSLLLVRQILPTEGLDWLSRDLRLFSQWVACIGGDMDAAETIGEIVDRADRESVARNLGAEPDPKSFESRARPLHVKLLNGLRHLLTAGELPLNRNGAAGWLVGDDLWLVSKRAVDILRTHLIAEGQTGIPNRNDRIFDELQQRGILIPCNDRAIWRAKVKGDGWEHVLTLIRLPASKIWIDPAARPESFSGEVISELEENNSNGAATIRPNEDDGVSAGKSILDADHNENRSGFLPRARAGENPECVPLAEDSEIVNGTTIQERSEIGCAHKDPGRWFLNWVRENLRNGKLPIDVPNARIHIVAEGTFLVSPAIFKEFVEKTGANSSWEQVQKRFLKLNVHAKTPDGLNVHKYKVKGAILHGIVVSELADDAQTQSGGQPCRIAVGYTKAE
ncbi:MAG: MobH family relaxase [Methylococcales bacterium]